MRGVFSYQAKIMTILFNLTHEGGDLSEYDVTSTGGGDLSVSASAALGWSNYGLQSVVDDTTAQYGRKYFTAASSVRLRLYFDPNSFTFSGGEGYINLLRLDNSASQSAGFLYVFPDDPYSISLWAIYDSGGWALVTTGSLADKPAYVEAIWQAATAPGADDGYCELWINGISAGSKVDLDTDARHAALNRLTVGSLDISEITGGTLYLDEIKGTDDGAEIGPIYEEQTASHLLDTILQGSQTASHLLDTILQEGQTASHKIDTVLSEEAEPQFARPDSDVSFSNWTGSYTAIDEETASDSDYITGTDDANGTAEVGLSDVTDPAVGTGHTFRFRARKEASGGHTRGVTVGLYDGATLIGSYAVTDLPATFTAYSYTLSEAEANNITDYSDLRLRFTSTGTTSTPAPNRRYVYLSWAELEVPDAGSAPTPRSATHLFDTILQQGQTASHLLDTALQTGRSASHLLDSDLKQTETLTTLFDTILVKGQIIQAVTGTVVQGEKSGQFTLVSCLNSPQNVTHAFDAVLCQINALVAQIWAISTVSGECDTTIDTALKTAQIVSHGLTAICSQQISGSHTLETGIRQGQTVNHSIGAYLSGAGTATHILDGTLQAGQSATHLLDLVTQALQVNSHGLEGITQAGQSATHLFELVTRQSQACHITVETGIRQGQTISHSVGVCLSGAGTVTHRLGTVTQAEQTVTHLFDAILQDSHATSLTVWADLQFPPRSVTTGLETVITATNTATCIVWGALSQVTTSLVATRLMAEFDPELALVAVFELETAMGAEFELTTLLKGNV
jgi:hypothetical protein